MTAGNYFITWYPSLAGGVTHFSRLAPDSPGEHFSSFAPKLSFFSTRGPPGGVVVCYYEVLNLGQLCHPINCDVSIALWVQLLLLASNAAQEK